MFSDFFEDFRVALAFVLVMFVLALGQCQAHPSREEAASGQVAVTEEPTAGIKSAVDLSTAIARVAKETIPAVVHIEVTERQEVSNPFLPFENERYIYSYEQKG